MSDISKLVDKTVDTDVLIVGSEGAGARAAIECSKYLVKVLVVTKGRIGRCGATMTAGADFTVGGRGLYEILGYDGDMRDSPELFMKEIVADGGFLSNQKLVESYVQDAPKRVKELLDWGMRMTGTEAAHGQEYKRAIRTEGPEIAKTYRNEVKKRNIPLMEDTMVVDILTRNGKAVGAVGLNFKTGELVLFRASSIVLATGGWQMAYPRTSATDDLTGDGQAMAYRAGAELVDMEMVEFSGRTIYPRGYDRHRFINSIRPHLGAYRLNGKMDKRFMDLYDPTGRYRQGGHVPIVYVAIDSEVKAGRGSPHGGVYLTIDGVPDIEQKWNKAERGLFQGWKMYGVSFKDFMDYWKTNKVVEEGTVAHFHCGGVKTTENFETSVAGLYVTGECAGSLWGANRVAAATTQVFVQGAIAGRCAAEYVCSGEAYGAGAKLTDEIGIEQLRQIKAKILAPLDRKEGISPIAIRKRIHKLASENIGVVKNAVGLQEAIRELERIRKEDLPRVFTVGKNRNCNREWLEAIQLENMVTCLEASARSALMREESRMIHYRTDCLTVDHDKWLKNIVVKKDGDKMHITAHPVVVTSVPLPKGTMTYEQAHTMGSWAEIK